VLSHGARRRRGHRPGPVPAPRRQGRRGRRLAAAAAPWLSHRL